MISDVGGSINSVQNGLLLRSDIHQLFDMYRISINPDVCILYFFRKKVANYYFRTIIRLYVLDAIERVSLANILKDLPMIPKDQLNSFYVGISGRLF